MKRRRVVAAGARMFTHLFNAMRPLNHRDPGVIAAALTNEVAMPAVIPDGVHVAPEILRLIYMARGAGRMILTTDKVSLAGTATDASLNVSRERRASPMARRGSRMAPSPARSSRCSTARA